MIYIYNLRLYPSIATISFSDKNSYMLFWKVNFSHQKKYCQRYTAQNLPSFQTFLHMMKPCVRSIELIEIKHKTLSRYLLVIFHLHNPHRSLMNCSYSYHSTLKIFKLKQKKIRCNYNVKVYVCMCVKGIGNITYYLACH